jgi:hypothetical protein
MKMKWIKKNRIIKPNDLTGWMNSHAQCPNAIVLEDRIRVYFSTRLSNQVSLPVFVDVEKNNPEKIIEFSEEPILTYGDFGTFDENGIIPSYVMKKDDDIYLYYAGWSQCKNVPYKNFTGLAISHDTGRTFKRYSKGPVFGMNSFDHLSATGPWVIHKDNLFYAIYSTGTNWLNIDKKLEHTYLLTYATSSDAINWKPSGKIIINPESQYDAHCKPAILEIDGTYHMWFSKRGSFNFRSSGESAYRLGYAYSNDLVHWTRDDKNGGISVSSKGWDSEMMCYPNIVSVQNKHYLFYNGNGFGKSGFGYALLDQDNKK